MLEKQAVKEKKFSFDVDSFKQSFTVTVVVIDGIELFSSVFT